MNANEIKEQLTENQIKLLLKELGAIDPKFDSQGHHIYKTVCHHGESEKLYYYPESKIFKCYTECSESFDIFGLVEKNRSCSFVEAIHYICNLFDIHQSSRPKGFITKHLTDDWDVINKYLKNKYQPISPTIHVINDNILNLFKDLYHISWINDGISVEAMEKYQIKFDIIRNKIIIPHFNVDGQLIGIRGRALNMDEVEAGKKYMPIYIERDEYKHSLGQTLYGLHQTKKAIQRIGKIAIFESEKSVLQCETFYGEDNFTVAACGSNITNTQRKIILDQGVREVFICYDRQFLERESEEAYKYADKLRYLASKFSPYVTTYILWDNQDLLPYKASPSDRGKEILEKLMRSKYEIKSNEMES